jgi:Ca2+-binding RTX toxin-like protein
VRFVVTFFNERLFSAGTGRRRCRAAIIVLALLPLLQIAGLIGRSAHAQDPNFKLAINPGPNQTVVLSWFGENGVPYQLQSSPDLVAWSDLGSITFGANAVIDVTTSIAGESKAFFRLKQFTPDPTTAVFDPASGVLTVTGTSGDNRISVSRDASGNIRVNGGLVFISGGTPTSANTTLIRVFGGNGADELVIDEINGAMPAANLFGEGDDDTLIGGSAADVLNGGSGHDTLLGGAGADMLLGGDGNDTLTGGDGDDQVFGEGDDDRMIWNPGDDTDLNEGGIGTDTVEVNGGNGAETFTTTANGTRVRFDRVTPAPFAIDIGTSEKLVLNANGGDDNFSATGNLAALIQITVDGGAGNDTILGSNGADILFGGDNDDFIDGQQGNDVVFLGADNDTFQWDPGDGSDVIEGQAGNDRMIFNGSGTAEIFDMAANGSRVRFTRNIGNIVMDLDDVETIDVNALGGTDLVTVNALAGTDLTTVNANLAGTIGGSTSDAAVDNVIINGSAADDIFSATFASNVLSVRSGITSVNISNFDLTDSIQIEGLGGDDIVDASAVATGGPQLALDGGTGNDILLGSAANDTMHGDENDDVLLGNGGVDVLDGGLGDNIVVQDGANVVSGIISIFGNLQDNSFVISRDAAGAILSNGVPIPGATVANTTLIRVFGMSGDDVITFDETNGAMPAAFLFGGAGNDTLTGGAASDFIFGGAGNDTLLGKGGVDTLFGGAGNDMLSGGDGNDLLFGGGYDDLMMWNPGDDTDLNEGGAGTDTVEVNGGNGAETFTTTANGTRVRFDRVTPAPFAIDIGTSEKLVLNANGGDDSFSATGNLAALIQITVDGGAGNDTILGSNGADILIGGDNDDFIDGQQGNDTVFLGADNDTFQWDPGDGNDIVEGQAGNDRMIFNGANIAENFAVLANGGRILFTRNIANIVMDLDGVETLEVNALGGVDAFTINDLSATDLTTVIANLASTIGGGAGDMVADVITVNGTAAPDTISVIANGGAVEVGGLPTAVRITRSEIANDDLVINGLGGADLFNIGPGVNTLIEVLTNQ